MTKVIKNNLPSKHLIINEHFEKNIWLYLISMLCICIGVVLGVYSVKYMKNMDKSNMVAWMTNSVKMLKEGSVSYHEVFISSLTNYLPMIVVIWFLGLTIVGIPIILILDIVKGYSLGFTLSFIVNIFGLKGLGIGILGILTQNIVFIPCIVILSVMAMEFSINIVKDKNQSGVIKGILGRIVNYSLSFIFIFAIMSLGFLIEAYISPSVINNINGISMIGIWKISI